MWIQNRFTNDLRWKFKNTLTNIDNKLFMYEKLKIKSDGINTTT